ncbi:hypothetical protein NIES4071_01680 [Calothrix sp. NIES-4071]|nr:hypothetical protein NIES4071_01680 [Calothrix sp. NIES-4071]BAZ54514.1 hypothetical protein NIES4105_01670 [Calothrix sp. NIES-4105]
MYLQIAILRPANLSKQNDVVINPLIGYSIISLPLLLLLIITSVHKYQAYMFSRRVAKLEKVWHLSLKSKAP